MHLQHIDCPTLLVSCVHHTSRHNPDHLQLSIPTSKLHLGKHAFSVAAPSICNENPNTLKPSEGWSSFHKYLKTSFLNSISRLDPQALPFLIKALACSSFLIIVFSALLSRAPRGFQRFTSCCYYDSFCRSAILLFVSASIWMLLDLVMIDWSESMPGCTATPLPQLLSTHRHYIWLMHVIIWQLAKVTSFIRCS